MTILPDDSWYTSAAVFLCYDFTWDLNFLGYKAQANSVSLEIAKLVSHLALPNSIQLIIQLIGFNQLIKHSINWIQLMLNSIN